MKTAILLLFTVLLSAKISFSQDTLLMRNNTIILAKVLEVLPTEVKYNWSVTKNGITNSFRDSVVYTAGVTGKYNLNY